MKKNIIYSKKFKIKNGGVKIKIKTKNEIINNKIYKMKVLILCLLIGYIRPFSPDKCAAKALELCDYEFHWSNSTLTQIGFIQLSLREGGLELVCLYTSSPHSDGTLENYPLVIEFDDIAPMYPSYLAIATYVDSKTIKYSITSKFM